MELDETIAQTLQQEDIGGQEFLALTKEEFKDLFNKLGPRKRAESWQENLKSNVSVCMDIYNAMPLCIQNVT